jgi:hypothetical protein
LRHEETNTKERYSIPIDGAAADIRAFLEAVKWEDEIFDFDRTTPTAASINHTRSGDRTIDGARVTARYVINPTMTSVILIGIAGRTDQWGTKWNACRTELT